LEVFSRDECLRWQGGSGRGGRRWVLIPMVFLVGLSAGFLGFVGIFFGGQVSLGLFLGRGIVCLGGIVGDFDRSWLLVWGLVVICFMFFCLANVLLEGGG